MKISELIAALQEHQAEYGDTEVEFLGHYGSSEHVGTEVLPAPEKMYGPWRRDDRLNHDALVKAWRQSGRRVLIWTDLSNG